MLRMFTEYTHNKTTLFGNCNMLRILDLCMYNATPPGNMPFKIAGRFIHSAMSMHQAVIREITQGIKLEPLNEQTVNSINECTKEVKERELQQAMLLAMGY